MCIYAMKIDTSLIQSRRNVSSSITQKGFKLWDMIKMKMVISSDVVFVKLLILKKIIETNVSTYEGETSNK